MGSRNLLVILIDDMGWRDVGVCGSDFYETPFLDSLAARSTRFTQAYAACPVCSPSRASLMTGKYPARLGITNWIGGSARGRLIEPPNSDRLAASEKTLASRLRGEGYHTLHVGKWHLGGQGSLATDHGFDENIGGSAWGHPKNGHFSPYKMPNLADGPSGEYLMDRITDEALRLIERSCDRPFFLNFWPYAVHTPIQAPDTLVRKYKDKAAALGLDKKQAFAEGELFRTERQKDRHIVRRLFQSDPVYAAMVENLDTNIGRVLEAVQAQAPDTAVIFTSDNGGLSTAAGSPTCNLPLSEGKGWVYEGGLRVPLMVHLPGAKPGLCEVPVTTPDLYPTALDLLGLPLDPDQHCDGQSLKPLVTGSGRLEREAIYWHYPHYGDQGGAPAACVRAGDLKLIEHWETRQIELFDIASDTSESRDLSKERTDEAQRLRRMLIDWQKSVGAPEPYTNPDWKP